jgi:hypothetical protein
VIRVLGIRATHSPRIAWILSIERINLNNGIRRSGWEHTSCLLFEYGRTKARNYSTSYTMGTFNGLTICKHERNLRDIDGEPDSRGRSNKSSNCTSSLTDSKSCIAPEDGRGSGDSEDRPKREPRRGVTRDSETVTSCAVIMSSL